MGRDLGAETIGDAMTALGVLFVLLWSVAVVGMISTLTGIGVTYAYCVEHGELLVRIRWLWCLRFVGARLPLANVRECRRWDLARDAFPGGWLWGIVLRRWWTLVLYRRVWGLRMIFITPSDAEIVELRQALKAPAATPA